MQINNNKSKKSAAPPAVQKKVQEVIAVHCLNWVYTLPSMKLDDLQKKMASAFHGDEKAGVISFTEQCLSGSGVFGGLWDEEEDSLGNKVLILKLTLTRRPSCQFISGTAVTVDTIQHTNQKNKVVIESRSIYNLGCNTLTNSS
jgi:hypothetical protein